MTVDTVSTEELENLVNEFSKLGTQIAFNMCMRFIEKIKEDYPKVPKEEFVNLAIKTFNENKIQVDAKVQAPRSKVKDENRCEKVLTTGKRQGHRCSLRRTEASKYCKRHRNKILTSSGKDASRDQVVKDYLANIGSLQPKATDIKKPVPLKLRQYKEKNAYLEIGTNIMFYLNDKEEYIAFGVFKEGIMVDLTEKDKLICEKNIWKYEENVDAKKILEV
jgi:hypothetical protein